MKNPKKRMALELSRAAKMREALNVCKPVVCRRKNSLSYIENKN